MDEAFQRWDDISGLEFLRVDDSGLPMYEGTNPDSRVYALPLRGGLAGQAYDPYDNGIGSDIELNSTEPFTRSADGYRNTLLHEIGHTIGIKDHSTNSNDAMYHELKWGDMQLSPDDVQRAQAIYGQPFSNRELLLDTNVGPVASFYRAAFDRDPDNAGFLWNYNKLDSGEMDKKGLANVFINSQEFNSAGKSDDDFINALYGNIFDRSADTDGLGYWKGRLSSDLDRADVLLNFADSQENKDKLMSLYGEKMWYDMI
jgi:Domain of unknown function (DUF4214)/Matrixin